MGDVSSVAYLEGEMQGQTRRFVLTTDGVFRIGRTAKNDIVLSDDLASRHHAMLQRSGDGQFYISDLGSSNGTLVNGARISVPLILRPGDHISIGNHEFTFFQEAAAPFAPLETTHDFESTNILFAEKLITVLVVDIRDFTGLARRIEGAKLSQLMATFFREAGKVLQERGAWQQKYIGDAVMAVWLHDMHAPGSRELLAIFEGIYVLSGIAARLQHRFGLDLPIRIGAGLNTGMASIGNVGSIASSDHTALGDVVNKAFRLESASKDLSCDLVLGQPTYELVARCMSVAPPFQTCTAKLKGYDEHVKVYTAQLTSLPALLDVLGAN